jgi:chemotaxis protein methyltransferase CheR
MSRQPLIAPSSDAIADDDVVGFCEWIQQRFGYDFRSYQVEPLRKSLAAILRRRDLPTVAQLIKTYETEALPGAAIVSELTITTSTMFRNPRVFKALVSEVFPYLETYNSLKIWHAGCSRGEEVYSLAILLEEHGLLERTRLYATDINAAALTAAREGIYPQRRIKEFNQNYVAAGGTRSLSDYFELRYGHAKLSTRLAKNILFSKHDLVSDSSFGEMHLILCRNVLIYFSAELQRHALKLFRDSMITGGFLCLGLSEPFTSWLTELDLKPHDKKAMIYRAQG